MGRPLSPKKNTPDCDLVYTPKELACSIIQHFNPEGVILDPCRGTGAFYDSYPLTSVKYYCEIEENIDFFDFDKKVDWIITNPPWSKFKEFLSHGMKIADNIVYLVTINHFMTKARIRMIRENGYGFKEILMVETPKTDWPQSGFQLAAIHIQKDWSGPVTITYK